MQRDEDLAQIEQRNHLRKEFSLPLLDVPSEMARLKRSVKRRPSNIMLNASPIVSRISWPNDRAG